MFKYIRYKCVDILLFQTGKRVFSFLLRKSVKRPWPPQVPDVADGPDFTIRDCQNVLHFSLFL